MRHPELTHEGELAFRFEPPAGPSVPRALLHFSTSACGHGDVCATAARGSHEAHEACPSTPCSVSSAAGSYGRSRMHLVTSDSKRCGWAPGTATTCFLWATARESIQWRPRRSDQFQSARHEHSATQSLAHMTNQQAVRSLSPKACSFSRTSNPTQEGRKPTELVGGGRQF